MNETLTGPVRANHALPGFDVVVSLYTTTHSGHAMIDISTDAEHWQTLRVIPAVANETRGLRFSPSWGFYRVRWESSHAASRVLVQSQMVEPVVPIEIGQVILDARAAEAAEAAWVADESTRPAPAAPAAPAAAPVAAPSWLQRLLTKGWI